MFHVEKKYRLELPGDIALSCGLVMHDNVPLVSVFPLCVPNRPLPNACPGGVVGLCHSARCRVAVPGAASALVRSRQGSGLAPTSD